MGPPFNITRKKNDMRAKIAKNDIQAQIAKHDMRARVEGSGPHDFDCIRTFERGCLEREARRLAAELKEVTNRLAHY